MAYLPEDHQNLNEDVLTRKEFFHLKKVQQPSIFDDDLVSRFPLDPYIESGLFLRLQNYQMFVRNFFSPHTPYSRLLIKHSTGTGKTISALSIAMEFINQFKIQSESIEDIGSVFIIGFTERIFKNELLKFPEFGFINRQEIQKWKSLKRNANSGSKLDLEKLSEFQTMVKKRIISRKGNGFFKFYGYKQLINRLFILSSDATLSDMTHDEIRKAIQEGEISYNMEILEQFKNSLMICDEIHNTYNSLILNNWGFGLQVILDYHPSLRSVFMSATPINNSPTEIVDLLNLLVPKKFLPQQRLLTREDLFDDRDLKSTSIKTIADIIQGRVSFLRDINPSYFPSRCILGERIKGISYLRFIRSPMSSFHYQTYKNNFTGTLPQDSQYLVDFVLPDPSVPMDKTFKSDGMFRTIATKRKLVTASREWKDKYQFDFINKSITGESLHKSTLGTYSAKYKRMIVDIHAMLKNKRGKIFIFHNVVHMSGVLFIQQVLLKNGIIDESGIPTDDTLCSVCGYERKLHKILDKTLSKISEGGYELEITGSVLIKKNIDDHEYMPTRVIMIHADIDRLTIYNNIEKFNLPDNAEGHKYMILLGSRVIKEAHNVECVQNTMIMGRPDNIATLIQILGRTVRKYSHKNLPLDKRHVNVYIYTSCLPIKVKKEFLLSYEEKRYQDKIEDYKIIQRIEKIFHENAVDAIINRDIITLKSDVKTLRNCTYDLDILDFEPVLFKKMGKTQACKNFTLDELNLSTFTVYHNQKEIDIITLIIKQLFTEVSPVWEFDDLWKAIRELQSPFEINTRLFELSNFVIALSKLVFISNSEYIEPYVSFNQQNKDSMEEIIDRMFDPSHKRILIGKQEAIIKQIGKYYILFPIDIDTGEPIIDIEVSYRGFHKQKPRNISIKQYLNTVKKEFNYDIKKQKFYEKYRDVNIDQMKLAICDYGNDFHICLVEECIECVFTNWVFPYKKKPLMYEFYFKMLYYYDMMGSIIWANTAKDYIVNLYKKYILSDDQTKQPIMAEEIGRKAILNLLQSTIDKTSCIDCSSDAIERYKESINKNIKIVKKYAKRKVPGGKEVIIPSPANKLPIGHFFKYIPRFYHPIRLWFDAPEYFESKIEWVENDIIIGYEEKTQLRTKFKIRSPIHKIKQFRDIRMIEKGSICTSKNKKYLIKLAVDLKIKLPPNINIIILCNKIHTQLLKLEFEERKKQSNIKYFYFFFEPQLVIPIAKR